MTAESKKNTAELSTTDSLNRATLRLTFNTVRKSSPSSALLIQNLLMQQHTLPTDKANTDLFTITFDDGQIEHVIQALLALCLLASQQPSPSVSMNTLRGLLSQWTKVANYRKLFSEVESF